MSMNAKELHAMAVLYQALFRVYNADHSQNNGMFNGEARLCPAFAEEAHNALETAMPFVMGAKTENGYFGFLKAKD